MNGSLFAFDLKSVTRKKIAVLNQDRTHSFLSRFIFSHSMSSSPFMAVHWTPRIIAHPIITRGATLHLNMSMDADADFDMGLEIGVDNHLSDVRDVVEDILYRKYGQARPFWLCLNESTTFLLRMDTGATFAERIKKGHAPERIVDPSILQLALKEGDSIRIVLNE